jgi:hypothetical protein
VVAFNASNRFREVAADCSVSREAERKPGSTAKSASNEIAGVLPDWTMRAGICGCGNGCSRRDEERLRRTARTQAPRRLKIALAGTILYRIGRTVEPGRPACRASAYCRTGIDQHATGCAASQLACTARQRRRVRFGAVRGRSGTRQSVQCGAMARKLFERYDSRLTMASGFTFHDEDADAGGLQRDRPRLPCQITGGAIVGKSANDRVERENAAWRSAELLTKRHRQAVRRRRHLDRE